MHLPRPALAALSTLLLAAACAPDNVAAPGASPLTPTLRSASSDPTPATIALRRIGSFEGGGPAAAEVTAYDEVSRRLFVVNGALGTVDVLDLKDPSAPAKVATLAVGALGVSANSVAAHGGLVAVAIQAQVKTAPGAVAFYRATTLELVSSVTVGALPDMLAFTPDGRQVVVANEGEPNDDYTEDPEGSVSVIDVSNANRPTVRTAGFGGWNGRGAALRAAGVRIYGPGATVAQDLEPEYVAVAADGATAWVTLQENNALAIVDLARAVVTDVRPLGYKDHSVAANALDASDRDGPANGPAIQIRPWPVFGMYQPDAIAAYEANGATYLVLANEGDARDWTGTPGFREEARAASLPLNPAIFTSAACGGSCTANARLGRLNVTTQHGRNAQTGLYDTLFVFGARSFSIRRPSGELVWDSGDALERLTTSLPMVAFNASNSGNALDDRSDNKGPEPEGLALATFGERTYAFVGLERVGGVAVWDITSPAAPAFVTYANGRNGASGDLGPEGVLVIPARRSPTRRPLLVVGNEVSGTTAVFEIELR